MQYLNTHSETRLQSGVRSIRLKYLLLIPLTVLALFELSASQLILLTLASGLGLSFIERVNGLAGTGGLYDGGASGSGSFDGGTFTTETRPVLPRGGIKIVYDGGSFERAQLKP